MGTVSRSGARVARVGAGCLLLVGLVACARRSPEERAYVETLVHQRAAKDTEMQSASGPLLDAQRRRFQGLAYYRPRLDLVFDVPLEPSARADTVRFITSQNTYDTFVRLGVFRFDYRGRPHALALFQSVDNGSLFLPFTDLTSGDTTYGAGRYLNPDPLQDGHYRLDFNLAYNPYCAYNARWICPIAPPENHLDFRVEAGERNFPYKEG